MVLYSDRLKKSIEYRKTPAFILLRGSVGRVFGGLSFHYSLFSFLGYQIRRGVAKIVLRPLRVLKAFQFLWGKLRYGKASAEKLILL